jgi:iron complex transport system permease protein
LAGPGHARLLLVSAVNGASLVLLADLAARTLRAPAELQAGILTAFIGAPFFLALLLSRREDAA